MKIVEKTHKFFDNLTKSIVFVVAILWAVFLFFLPIFSNGFSGITIIDAFNKDLIGPAVMVLIGSCFIMAGGIANPLLGILSLKQFEIYKNIKFKNTQNLKYMKNTINEKYIIPVHFVLSPILLIAGIVLVFTSTLVTANILGIEPSLIKVGSGIIVTLCISAILIVSSIISSILNTNKLLNELEKEINEEKNKELI